MFLPPTVPYLAEDGSNWTIFAAHFQEAMRAIHYWGYLDGTITQPVPKDATHPTIAERQATKEWEHGNGPARGLLTPRLADKTLLSICHHTTAKAQWDTLIQKFGHPGNPNLNTPEGVAHPEPDLTPGEDANSNANVPMHSDGVGLDLLMEEEDDRSLKVEEEEIAGNDASVERDMGPRIELQNPGVSPLATHEDAGSSPSPSSSSSSPLTPEAASTQCSLVVNPGTSATPDSDSDDDAKKAFRTETLGVEDEHALGRAGLYGRLVKEGEEWDADEEAGACTTTLVVDAPHVESRPIPYNALHVCVHSHTPATLGAPDEEEEDL